MRKVYKPLYLIIIMKKLIIHSLKKKSNAERCEIFQKLFGYRDNSNKGQYFYDRKGLLNNLNYKKELKNILYFSTNAKRKKVVEIFKKMKIEFLLANT